MNTTQLTEYIYSQLRQGLSAQDITAQLRTANWPEDAIVASFAAAQAQLIPAPLQTPTDTLSAPTTPATGSTQLPPPLKKSRIKIGWMLFKQSLRVIKQNPELSRYVVMTFLLSAAIFGILVAIIIIDGSHSNILFTLTKDTDNQTSYSPTLPGLIVLIISGYIMTLITYFYGTALASHVLGIFRGKPETYAAHIKLTRKKFVTIALYALIATIVGYILRLIEQRFKLIGLIISRILGVLWTLATSFVLPIIADTDDNAVASLKKSVALFKATWGETITSRIALTGLVFLLYFVIGIPVTIGLILVLAGLFGTVGVLVAIGLFLLGVIVIAILEALAGNILNVSLYYYAQYKVVPPSFSPELLASVFVSKKKK